MKKLSEDKYQILPPLSDAEYRELKADVEKRGVMVPIEYDELGNILDGHHRVKICEELGIKEWPRLVRRGWTDEEKKAHAIALNIARRHLNKKDREKLWAEMRKAGMTLEAIAKADGTVSKSTVHEVLKEQFSDSGKLTGKDGKTYPTKKKPRKKKTVYVSEETAKKANKLPDTQKQAVLLGEKKPMEAAREAKVEELSKIVTWPEGKYRVIYADPPWGYKNTQPDYHTEQRDHYPVKTVEEVREMPVSELLTDDAVLFLWVTSPILEESFEVVNSWGFEYKASFVWDKVKHNMGHYNSVRHEILLVCVKGSCQPDVRKLYDSVVTEERTEHSKKPEIFYEIIETLYPYGKRLELFSRNARDGWDRYGYEA